MSITQRNVYYDSYDSYYAVFLIRVAQCGPLESEENKTNFYDAVDDATLLLVKHLEVRGTT